MSTWIRCQTQLVPNVVKFTHSILGLYPGVASSLVSRGFLGTLPGDSSWKTEEGSFHSRHLEGLTGEARPVSCHWSVVLIRRLSPGPTSPEYSPVFTTQPTHPRLTLYTAGYLHTAVPHCSHSRAPLFTQPCTGRTMSKALCIYVAGLCARCPAV